MTPDFTEAQVEARTIGPVADELRFLRVEVFNRTLIEVTFADTDDFKKSIKILLEELLREVGHE